MMHVAVFLQGCEVIEPRWLAFGTSALRLCDVSGSTGSDTGESGIGRCLVTEILRMEEPAAGVVLVERHMELPVRYGNRITVLFETGADHG